MKRDTLQIVVFNFLILVTAFLTLLIHFIPGNL